MTRLILAMFLLASAMQAQVFYGDEYRKAEYQCSICGKSIFQNEKVEKRFPLFNDQGFGTLGSYGVEHIPDTLLVYGININLGTGKICRTCKLKYDEEINDLMQNLWNTWLKGVMFWHTKDRMRHDAILKAKAKASLDTQIKELEAKRRALR